MIRVVIEGPKYVGKTTLADRLRLWDPSCTTVAFRGYFCDSATTRPYEGTLEALDRLVQLAEVAPRGHSIVFERLHIFDYVNRAAQGETRAWCNYRALDERLTALGFALVVLISDLSTLQRRRSERLAERLPPSDTLLAAHLRLYERAHQESLMNKLVVRSDLHTPDEIAALVVERVSRV